MPSGYAIDFGQVPYRLSCCRAEVRPTTGASPSTSPMCAVPSRPSPPRSIQASQPARCSVQLSTLHLYTRRPSTESSTVPGLGSWHSLCCSCLQLYCCFFCRCHCCPSLAVWRRPDCRRSGRRHFLGWKSLPQRPPAWMPSYPWGISTYT